MTDLSMPAPKRGTLPPRRLIAAGMIRRAPGRTLTVRVTAAGVTGTIAKTGDSYVAAARADHLAHCTGCREIDAEVEARAAANGESMARRDRRQLGLGRRAMPVRGW